MDELRDEGIDRWRNRQMNEYRWMNRQMDENTLT